MATAAVGLTNASAASASPSFVQQVSGRGHTGSLTVTPGSAVTAGDRMVVEVAVWNSSHATASSVTDSAGNSYTELTHFTASDGTELSVWTAPITAGGGTKPTITAKAGSTADIGVAALEYAGPSAAAGVSGDQCRWRQVLAVREVPAPRRRMWTRSGRAASAWSSAPSTVKPASAIIARSALPGWPSLVR
jgi:hypothetical protein